ncbi:nucleotidyltransferase family protein [Pantoea sp. FN0305]|uniref:nucleotidyltransferase family protein n=1 Tax=Pantoea sp. FN0305 TaxID=3418559 RepID=UPI003CF59BEA
MSKNWKKVLLSPGATLKQALSILDKEALRIVLIVDEKSKLLGVVTDGDIRRAILNNISLEEPVTIIMNPNPITASPDSNRNMLVRIMNEKGILSVPLIEKHTGILRGLELLEQSPIIAHYKNPVFIMAGGFGTRLKPLTDSCPKPMLYVGNKPILEILINQFSQSGFVNFYISTHYMPEQITNYFGDGGKWGINISYVHEVSPLGTGGALGLLPDNLPDLPLIMINGDILTTLEPEKLLAFHNEQGGIATMCVREYEYQVPYGVVNGDGLRISSMIEKPVHKYFVNAGIYVVSSELYRTVEINRKIDMPTLLEQQMVKGKEVMMFPLHEYWLDIGRMDDFVKAQDDVKGLFK